MTIKIAHLYYDIMNLYGESGNVRALEQYFKNQSIECEIHFLTVDDEIDFNEYDVYYMGMGTENGQLIVLNDLIKYKENIKTSIENGKYFFVTGNSYELFGQYIIDKNDKKIEALGIFDYFSKQIKEKNYYENFDCRIVGDVVGKTNYINELIIGFQNKGSIIENNNSPFIKVTKGVGHDLNILEEGYVYKNFLGTHIIGPLFIRNPYLTDYFVNNIIKEKMSNFKYVKKEETAEIKAYEVYVNNLENA